MFSWGVNLQGDRHTYFPFCRPTVDRRVGGIGFLTFTHSVYYNEYLFAKHIKWQ